MSDVVVGIDLGIRKLAYAIAREGEIQSTGAYEAKPKLRTLELHDVVSFLDSMIWDLVVCERANILVVVEEPLIGNNRAYSMKIAQTFGAVLSHLGVYQADVENRLDVIGVNVSTWKKETVGNGRADKEEVRNYINVVSTRYSALCGHDQDRYDACCVALYGCLLSARADQLTGGPR